MSACDTKRTGRDIRPMSAFAGEADIDQVRKVGDIFGLKVKPCGGAFAVPAFRDRACAGPAIGADRH
jgi:hypothetical protein